MNDDEIINLFLNTQLDIDYQKTTINGQKIEEYESGHYLPYSDEDLLNIGLDENVYDAVLESRFSLDEDLGENPEVHLVLGAYQNENLGEDYFAEFEFDFSIPHAELMKQTVHKKLEDVSVKTEEGTVKLTDFSMNKLQSIITAEIPEELEEKLYNGNEMIWGQTVKEIRYSMNCAVIQQMVNLNGVLKPVSGACISWILTVRFFYSRILTAIIWNYSFIPENLTWLQQTLSGLMTIL